MASFPPELFLAIGLHLHDPGCLATLATLASTHQDNYQLLLPLLYQFVDITSDDILYKFILAHFRLSPSSSLSPIASTVEATMPTNKPSTDETHCRTDAMADDIEVTSLASVPFKHLSKHSTQLYKPSSPHAHSLAVSLVHKLKLHQTLSPTTTTLILSLPSPVFPNATSLSLLKSVIYSMPMKGYSLQHPPECYTALIRLLQVKSLCFLRDPPQTEIQSVLLLGWPEVHPTETLIESLVERWAHLEVVYWHFRPATLVIGVRNHATERPEGEERAWSNQIRACFLQDALWLECSYLYDAWWRPDRREPDLQSDLSPFISEYGPIFANTRTKLVLCGKADQALVVSALVKDDVDSPYPDGWFERLAVEYAFDSDGILKTLEFVSDACCVVCGQDIE
ncbi:hypothetical protein M231_03149 [Tremella mesenterica]|uniref:Uncharacterized protein n=1 Tax=Tremella mesenterica TaxID=5217 RepID=A0A4Q1BNN4_TREME|nr:hypothetical protein M231_03149 [Tremella mesenterica]